MVASNQKITFDKNLPPKPTLFTLINLQSRQSHIIIIMIIIIFCLINIFAYNLDSIRNNFWIEKQQQFDILNLSVTRLGDFWKFLATNFLPKVAQMYSDSLGSSENIIFK